MYALNRIALHGLLLCAIGFCPPLQAQDVVDLQQSVHEAIQRAGHGVVEVIAYADNTGAMRALSDDPQVAIGQLLDSQSTVNAPARASGFVISTNGLVVTAAHVLRHANYIVVRESSGRRLRAEHLGTDDARDLALLRARIVDSRVLALNTDVAPTMGTFVVALGYPFGLGQAASFGIVSAVNQALTSHADTRFLQTDAAINSGNSGGPLIGLDGRVVGMQSVVLTPEGIHSGLGFAVPAAVVSEVVRRLEDPKRTGPWLGFLPVAAENAISIGYIIPESPAERAGLKRGTTITQFEGSDVRTLDLFRLRVSNMALGSVAELSTEHGRSYRVKAIARPDHVSFAGAADLDPGHVETRPLSPDEETLLSASLQGVRCTCSRKVALSECANCSEAKSLFSLARSRVIAGDTLDGIQRYLKAPCRITAWIDYTQNDSRALARCMNKIQRAMGPLVHVQYKHFPASAQSVVGWRQCINAVEIARQYGQELVVHRALVSENGGEWRSRLARLADHLLVSNDDFWTALRDSRFEEQIMKDLTEGPVVYDVRSSPQLFVDGVRYEGAIDCEPLLRVLEGIVLDATL